MPDLLFQLISFFFPLMIFGLLVLGVFLRGRRVNRNIKNAVLPGLRQSLKRYVDAPIEDNKLSASQWVLETQPKRSTTLKQLDVTIQLTQRQMFFALLSNRLMGNQDFIIFEGTLEKETIGLVIEIIPNREKKIIEKNYDYLVGLKEVNLGVSKRLDAAFLQKSDNIKLARKILGVRELLVRLLKTEEYLLWLTISKEPPHLRAIYRINDAFDVDNASKLTMELAARINP
ncbi:MAG: hypothetical protein ACE5I5_03980 [Candidatus Heimdallarchaeota archaeon]